jgi:hypothetical protein
VSAGIGPFNVSFTTDLYNTEYLAMVAMGEVWYLFEDSQKCQLQDSPANPSCNESDCRSYFCTGGWESIAPLPVQLSTTSSADMYVVRNGPGLQMDMWNVSSAEQPMVSQDCLTWGYSFAALTICIKASTVYPGSLIAGIKLPLNFRFNSQGMNVCPTELIIAEACLSNTTWSQSLPISTTFSISNRTVDTAYNINNLTIFDLFHYSTPNLLSISPTDLLQGLNRFYYDPPLGSNATSSTLGAINMINVLLRIFLNNGKGGAIDANLWLGQMLAYPLILFQNNAPTVTALVSPASDSPAPNPDLPPSLHVSLDTVNLQYRIIIPIYSALIYAILAGSTCLLCLVVMGWALCCVPGGLPNISSFPLVDFAARVAAAKEVDPTLLDGFARVAATTELGEPLRFVRLHLREFLVKEEGSEQQSVKTMAFTTNKDNKSYIGTKSYYQW